MECVLARTRKSLEHLKRFIEMFYAEVFKGMCEGAEAQRTIVRTVMRVYSRNVIRGMQIVEKLWQMGMVSTEAVIDTGLKSFKQGDEQVIPLLTLFSTRAVQMKSFL